MSSIALSSLPFNFSQTPCALTVKSGVGIDLGTTNSVIAVGTWNPTAPSTIEVLCLPVEQKTATMGSINDVLLPSIVALLGDKVLIGEGAKRFVAANASAIRRNRDYFFETKNEIGTDRIYPQAKAEYFTPGRVGGHILNYLIRSVDIKPDWTTVTVPSSFQTAQRLETMGAVGYAELDADQTSLLDEPLAAFLDYLSRHPLELAKGPGAITNLLVFDFGGGTCDIAIVSLNSRQGMEGWDVAPRSISRFHRLGGGDIDAAIVYDLLIPQLIVQNKLPPRAFDFAEKRNWLEPTLRPIAEQLKISLCREQARREKLHLRFDPNLEVRNPGIFELKQGNRRLTFAKPVLTATAFLEVLAPFLDKQILSSRGDEYRTSRSIFAPLFDAIDRSDLHRNEINICLMVGGSSNIPQVIKAVREALPLTQVVSYDESRMPQARKECVARGAAIAATVYAITGHHIFKTISPDSIVIRTTRNTVELISSGVSLPFEGECRELVAPQASRTQPLDIRVEIVAGSDQRLLFRSIWTLQPPVLKNEPLIIRFRLDENQVLKLNLIRTVTTQPFVEHKVESPLTNVHNPILPEIEAERLEREIAKGGLKQSELEHKIVELLTLLKQLGQYEKALTISRRLLATKKPDFSLLSSMAETLEAMGDYPEAIRLLEQAADLNPRSGAGYFNLAIFLRRHRQFENAAIAIERGIRREISAPYHTLRALVASDVGDVQQQKKSLQQAEKLWPGLNQMSEWSLRWYGIWAQEANNHDAEEAASDELRKRQRHTVKESDEGLLPATLGDHP